MTSIKGLGKSLVATRKLAGAAVLVLAIAGCASRRYYTSANCPPEFRAPPVYNAQTVDLSHFDGPPASNERVDRGDVLGVTIAAGLNADAITHFPVRVGEDGSAFLPEIGHLPLVGLELMGVEQMIAAACMHRGLYRQPQVTVTMKQRAVNRVTVIGAVKTPGIHELPRGSSYLMSALVAAGGLDEDAGTQVEVRRPVVQNRWGRATLASQQTVSSGPTAVRLTGNSSYVPQDQVELVCLDLANEVSLGPSGNYLDDGAVVRVERRYPEPIQVVGLVRKPGRYDFPVSHELRVLGAIAMAEGVSQQVADKVYVIRKTDNGRGPTVVIKVSLDAAKGNAAENIRLAPGDTVSVEQTPLTVMMDVINIIRFGIGANIPVY